MKSNLMKCVAVACLAAVLATPAWAQGSLQTSVQSTVQGAPRTVDGGVWLQSSPVVRRAFILGAGNMIALETAYSRKHGTPLPVAGDMASKALERLTLDQVSDRITRWYETNPGRRNVPVIGVLWMDMVKPDSVTK